VIASGLTGADFKVSATSGGSTINVTDTGSGTNYVTSTPGLAWTPVELDYNLGAADTFAIYTLHRTGGTNGALTLPYTTTDGTALYGDGSTQHYKIAQATRNDITGVFTPGTYGATGNIVFASGSKTAYLAVFLNNVGRNPGDPAVVSATINWTNAAVLNTGADTTTTLNLRLYDPA
jgi:hypothetical protein